jgi:hypothetical protein
MLSGVSINDQWRVYFRYDDGDAFDVAITALRLARYFGSTPQFWLNLQTSYDLKIAERTAGSKIEREVHRRLVA